MNKLRLRSFISDQKKTTIASVVAIVLLAVNLVPLHHTSIQKCPDGTSYTTEGTTMGLPVAYYENSEGGISTCPNFVGDAQTKRFSMQSLLTDGLVFGVLMVGLNALLDRRTKA
jgi:hypothetical protein